MIPDALKVISDVLKVISDDLPSCSLVVFLQIVEIGRYSRYTRYAATKFAAFNVEVFFLHSVTAIMGGEKWD